MLAILYRGRGLGGITSACETSCRIDGELSPVHIAPSHKPLLSLDVDDSLCDKHHAHLTCLEAFSSAEV